MFADIILIGQELLQGHIIDTNSAFLAQRLAGLGFIVREKAVVGDDEEQIATAILRSLEISPLVITSGGIGPTVDDRTREACARATGRPLMLDLDLESHIKGFHQKRGQVFGENSKRQAYIPQGAQPISNPVGTAPCFVIRHNKARLVVLPGVPRELKHLTEHFLLPFLQDEFELPYVAVSRTLHTGGVGESIIDRKIKELQASENPTLGLLASSGQVDIRLTARASDNSEAKFLLDDMEQKINQRLGDMIYGRDGESLAQVVVDLLQNVSDDLSLLETNTGGLLASRISAATGGLEVMPMALVGPLSRMAGLLDGYLPKRDLSVNQDTALLLAQAVREKSGTKIGLAVLGDEDPEMGPFKDKVGECFVAVQGPGTGQCRRVPQGGLSPVSRAWILGAALQLLRQHLMQTQKP